MSISRFFLIITTGLLLAGCSVPPPVPVPLPSAISGQPSPCEPLSLAGFPRQDPPSEKTYYICKPGVFAVNFNPDHRTPQWAVQHIQAQDSDPSSGPAARVDKNDTRPDPDLPESRASALDDFIDTGYELAYLVSPNSFPYDDIRYSRSQYLSNAFPIHPDKKQTWLGLTDFALTAARQRGQVKVISGTIYPNGVGRGWVGVADTSSSGDKGKVQVPESLFKVIVDPETGEYIAFLVSNGPTVENKPPAVITTWEEIERATGLVLAPDSPQSWRRYQSAPPSPEAWRP